MAIERECERMEIPGEERSSGRFNIACAIAILKVFLCRRNFYCGLNTLGENLFKTEQ